MPLISRWILLLWRQIRIAASTTKIIAIDGSPVRQKMASGEMMVLLTDGFFEWENDAGEEYGIDRTAEMVRRHADEPATRLIEILYDDVRRFAGESPQSDDLTSLVIRKL